MTYFTNNTKQRSNHTHRKKALCWLNAVQRAMISSREKAVKVTNHTQCILPPSFSGLNTSLKTNKANYEEITAFKKRRNSVSEEEAFTCSAQASLQIQTHCCVKPHPGTCRGRNEETEVEDAQTLWRLLQWGPCLHCALMTFQSIIFCKYEQLHM